MSSSHAREWKAAADLEYKSPVENGTWELVKLPVDCKPIKCNWVFKTKRGSDGSVDRFKGRLVAKGYAVWIMMKHTLQWSDSLPYIHCLLLL